MIQPIMKDPIFLAVPSEDAGEADVTVARDLMETLTANRDRCVGMAANMIGVRKRIVAVLDGFTSLILYNPEIIACSGPYETEEGCLSLEGTRKTLRYERITVSYLDRRLRPKTASFTGWVAQIIQHEVDHCNGVLI